MGSIAAMENGSKDRYFQENAKKLVPEKSDWIEVLADNVIRLRLGDIDKLQKAFEKVELKSICFEQDKACIGIGLL